MNGTFRCLDAAAVIAVIGLHDIDDPLECFRGIKIIEKGAKAKMSDVPLDELIYA